MKGILAVSFVKIEEAPQAAVARRVGNASPVHRHCPTARNSRVGARCSSGTVCLRLKVSPGCRLGGSGGRFALEGAGFR